MRGSLIAAVSLLAVTIVACGDGVGGEVRIMLDRAVEAYNGKHTDAFIALLTDRALQEDFQTDRANAPASLAPTIGDPPIEIRRIRDTEVSGAQATVEYDRTEGNLLIGERVRFVKEGEEWKIDGFEPVPTDIPGGRKRIDVELTEFAFAFDADEVEGGNVAFAARNAGEQDHEIVIARIPEDASLDELSQQIASAPPADDPPAGVEEIIGVDSFAPAEEGNIVPADPLEPGRYGLFCFFPDINDPEMRPHALKGMSAEFTVEDY